MRLAVKELKEPQFNGHNGHGNDEEDPDPAVSLVDLPPAAKPAPGRIAQGQHEAIIPVNHVFDNEDDQSPKLAH